MKYLTLCVINLEYIRVSFLIELQRKKLVLQVVHLSKTNLI